MSVRWFVACLAAVLPLAAQFRVENLSNQNLDELGLWEQYRDVAKQVRDLCVAGETSGGPFDVASEVAQTLNEQLRHDYPTLGKLILAGDHTRPARADITCNKARILWDGWDWNEPDANPMGTTRTVCAAGCDHTTLQACVNGMGFGDICELDADETFVASAGNHLVDLPDQHDFNGFCPYYSVIQSAGYSSNFAPGVAATAADVANMARLEGGNGEFNEIIEFGSVIATVNGGDTGADTLQTSAAHGFQVGDNLVWVRKEQAPNQWWRQATGELAETKPWHVVAVPTTTTLQVSETPGGAAYDLTTLPSTYGSFALRKYNRPVSCWKLRGLEVALQSGVGAKQELIRLSSVEPILETTPSHLIFQHMYVHGNPSAAGVDGPQSGIRVDGRNIAIRDSTVVDILGTDGGSNSHEGRAVWLARSYGPVWLENLRLSGAMTNVALGFVDPFVEYHYPGSNGGVVNRNLYVWKEPGWFVQHRPSTNPTPGTWCLPGMMWQNQTGPSCYRCGGSGTWGSTPEANCSAYNDLNIKNLWEIKHGAEALLWNFWGELSPFGDVSQEYWLTIKASQGGAGSPQWHNARFIGYNFRTRWTNSGPLLQGSVGGEHLGVRLGPQALWQGLMTEVDGTKFRYEDGTADIGDWNGQTGRLDTWEQVRHVTMTGYSDSNSQKWFLQKPDQGTPARTQYGMSFRDNIFQSAGIAANGAGNNHCLALTSSVVSTATPEWENNLTFGFSAPDLSACSTNYWNESAGANVGFADYANGDMELTSAGTGGDYRAGGARDASDGKDLGVDFEILDDGMGGRDGAGVKAGIGGWSQQYDVSITAIAATTATVEWDRPNAMNACNFYLYTDYARTSEHVDTAGDNGDNRDGGVSAGHVTFTLGTNSALTTQSEYWFEIDCPADSVKMVGSLFTN